MKTKYILLTIVVVGALLRLYGIADSPLWIDEEQSVLEANGISNLPSFSMVQVFSSGDFKNEKKISNIATAVVGRDSGNGILYVLVLSGWTSLTGNSVFGVRLVSWLFSVLTIVVVFKLAKELTDSVQSGYWSAFLFSVHHLSIIYAQEARAYAMATFFISVSVLCFLTICKNYQKIHWTTIMAYGVSSGVALLSHYFTFYILASQIIIAIIFFRKIEIWKSLIIGAVVTGVMISVWMICGGLQGLDIMQLRNARYQQQSVLDPENIFYGAATGRTILAGVFQLVTHQFSIGFQNAGLRIHETLPFLMFPVILIYLNISYVKEKMNIMFLLGIFIFSAPILAVMLALVSGHTISFQVLYANFSVPFCCVFIGILFDNLFSEWTTGRKFFLTLYVLMVLFSCILNLTSLRHGTVQGKNTMEEAVIIEASYKAGDTLKFNTVDDAMLTNLYFRNNEILQRVTPVSKEIK